MKRKPTILGSFGDPNSELNVQRRLQWLREVSGGGPIFISRSHVDRDPAMKKAVEELDWLCLEEKR